MNANVSSDFHDIIASGNYKTRLRIYSIDESIDCTNDADVIANGTLLVRNVGDTDSNRRIAEGGITLADYFCKSNEFEIGQTVSCQANFTLMNPDGGLDNFGYGKFKAYLDVADPDDMTWQTASLGVFYFDTPTKRRIQLVSVVARDQMSKLDEIATDWFDTINFPGGVTLQGILNDMAAYLGITVASQTLVNGTYTYYSKPLDSDSLTYRDILGWIAGTAGGVARFDRNGFLTIKFFEYATVDENENSGMLSVGLAMLGNADVYSKSTTVYGCGVFAFDLAEYDVNPVNKLVVKSSDTDFGTIIGTGTNAYELVNNPFMYGDTSAAITGRAQNIYNVISALGAYKPITISALTDWSIEAGDVINILVGNDEYPLPIFQQTIVWDGTSVKATMMSSGRPVRSVDSRQNRFDFRAERSVHQLEVTAENLLSRIETTEGNFSQIVQEVGSISSTVSAIGDNLNQMQSSITQLADSVTIQFGETNQAIADTQEDVSQEIQNIYSFIRLIASGVVIGESQSPIKMKLENDHLYFFTGDETSVNESNAIAYFSTNRLFVNNSTIQNLTLGTSTSALDVRILGTGDNICAFFGGRLS